MKNKGWSVPLISHRISGIWKFVLSVKHEFDSVFAIMLIMGRILAFGMTSGAVILH